MFAPSSDATPKLDSLWPVFQWPHSVRSVAKLSNKLPAQEFPTQLRTSITSAFPDRVAPAPKLASLAVFVVLGYGSTARGACVSMIKHVQEVNRRQGSGKRNGQDAAGAKVA